MIASQCHPGFAGREDRDRQAAMVRDQPESFAIMGPGQAVFAAFRDDMGWGGR